MRNLILSGLAAILSLMTTSCLGGGSNVFTNTVYGVVKINPATKKLAIESGEFAPYYFTPANGDILEGFNIEDCVILLYTLDFNASENSGAVIDANKTWSGVINQIEYIDSYGYSHVRDTSVVRENEVKLACAVDAGRDPAYYGGILYLTSDLVMLTDQRNDWELGFDVNAMPEKNPANNNSIYSFYVRAIKTLEGKSPERSTAVVNAFRVDNIIEKLVVDEQKAGRSQAILRFNYIKDIRSDGSPVWDKN